MSQPRRPLVASNQPAAVPGVGRRLFSASFASLGFHAVLFTLFLLLSASTQADLPVEAAQDNTVIGTDTQTYEAVKRDPFLSVVANDGSTERHQDPAHNGPVLGEVTIPGQSDPLDKPGLNNGVFEGVLRSMGPEFGLTKDGRGVRAPSEGPGPDAKLDTPLPPGGVIFGGKMPDYYKIVRGSAVTRERLLGEGGGSPASEAAVTKGLRWLVKNQFPDGGWRLDGNFPDKGTQNDIAGTAFGLLPFLGAGKTHKPGKEENPYEKPIEKALLFLMRKQDKRSGNFGGGMYGHALAAIAICEAYGLTQDPSLRRPAQLATNYIVLSQHHGGGWRYAPEQAGDLSVTGWQIMALKSAQMAGLDVPAINLKKAERFLDSCVNPNDEGYGYIGPTSTPTMTAVGLLSRQFMQAWGPQNIRLIKAIDLHLKPNAPGQKKDVYYYYYATQVLRHFGGETWKAWNAKMRDGLIKSQDDDPRSPQFGSWSSAGDQHGPSGGRLMITSLNLLTLEVYYRYLPLYYREAGAKK